ncbi:MAG: hypothetical protein WCH04_15670 [Gammaproteobacteria bacterium]
MNITKNLNSNFSRCGYCNRKLAEEDINITGFDTDGHPKSVGHCCISKMSTALFVGIPWKTRGFMFNDVIQFLEYKVVDVESIKRIHREKSLPYALHVFS